jgi:uncharacterized protein YaaN involved in tellurite resistance
VSQQGLIAMGIIKENNEQLMNGIERAKTVTLLAFRNSALVASALYNQQLSLKKLDSLSQASEGALRETVRNSERLRSEPQESMGGLQNVFDEALDTLGKLKTFKEKAFPKVEENVNKFRELTEERE